MTETGHQIAVAERARHRRQKGNAGCNGIDAGMDISGQGGSFDREANPGAVSMAGQGRSIGALRLQLFQLAFGGREGLRGADREPVPVSHHVTEQAAFGDRPIVVDVE